MPDGVEHVADLTVPTFMNRDLYGRMTSAARQKMDMRRCHPMALDGDPTREPIEIVRIWNPQDLSFIDASDAVTRVGEPRGQIAVVREHKQTFRIKVETADGIHVLTNSGQQIDDGWPALRVRSCGDVTARLVQQEVSMPLRQRDPASVDADVIVRGIRLRSKLADRSAIHGDASFEHQLLGRASRRHASLRQDLL